MGKFCGKKIKICVKRSAEVESKRAAIKSAEVLINFIPVYWLGNSGK